MKYQLIVQVEADALGEAITSITPLIVAQRAVLGTISEIASPPESTGRRKRDASRDTPTSQTRLGKLVLELLRTGPCTVEEISEHLREHRFASTSVSPVTSKLVAEGLVDRYTTSLNGKTTRAYRLASSSSLV